MTSTELLAALTLGLIYSPVAISLYLTFRVIRFSDLTCDGSFALGGACTGILLSSGVSPTLTLFASFLAGAGAGLATGLLTAYFKMTDLLAGILVSFMLYSINLKLMGAPNISLFGILTFFSAHTTPITLALFILALCALLFYLLKTECGLALRSLGINPELVRASGTSPAQLTCWTLALSNGLIALSSSFCVHYQGFTDISSGVGTVVFGLASLMLGEIMMPTSSLLLHLLRGVLGSITYRILISCALHANCLGLQTQDLNLLTGLLILLVITLSGQRRRTAC